MWGAGARGVRGVVDSSMHVDNFLFLTLRGRLSFSFNCFCSELQCPLFKLQLLSTPLINPLCNIAGRQVNNRVALFHDVVQMPPKNG